MRPKIIMSTFLIIAFLCCQEQPSKLRNRMLNAKQENANNLKDSLSKKEIMIMKEKEVFLLTNQKKQD